MSFLTKTNRLASCAAALGILSAALVGPTPAVAAQGLSTLYDGPFARVPAERETGRSVAAHCQIDGVTSADHWADAAAHLVLTQDPRRRW